MSEARDRLIDVPPRRKMALRRQSAGPPQERRFEGQWETRRLGDVGVFRKGRGIKRADLCETGVPCIRYGELYTQYENYVAKPVSRIPQHVADTAWPIRKGDLLLAGSGETADEIGICVAYVGDESAYAGGDIIVLRALGQDAVYLAHLLNAPVATNQKARMAQGDAIVHIRSDHLARVQLCLPPLPEQRAIAAVLSDVDELLGSLEALIDKKRAIKQAAMQELLPGRTRLPGFGGEWETRRLGSVATISMGRTPSRSNPKFWGGSHVWLSVGDLKGKVIRNSKERITDLATAQIQAVPAGTLLMSFKLSIGRVGFAGCDLYPALFTNGLEAG